MEHDDGSSDEGSESQPSGSLSRRRLLRLTLDLATGGACLGLAHHFGLIQRAARWLRSSTVALQACPSYEASALTSALRRAWGDCAPPPVKDRTVFVKTNLLDAVSPEVPVATDPRLVEAVVALLRDLGAARITVGDGSANRHDTLEVASRAGLLQRLKRYAAPCLDLNYADLLPVETAVADTGGKASLLERLYLPRPVMEADLVISLAKAKTHRFARLTATMKNLMGCVPGSKYGWPKNLLHWNGISRTIIELCRTITPGLGIVDAVVGMEGLGPRWGKARALGAIVMGTDLAAVDWVTARLMKLDPPSIDYLVAAELIGYGHGQGRGTTVRGARVTDLARAFEPARRKGPPPYGPKKGARS